MLVPMGYLGVAAVEGSSFQSVADRSISFMSSLDIITRMVGFGRGGAVLVVQLVEVSKRIGGSASQIIVEIIVPVPTHPLRETGAGSVQPQLCLDVKISCVCCSNLNCWLSSLAGLS